MLVLDQIGSRTFDASGVGDFDPKGSLPILAEPTQPMLGGFSADVVYRMLARWPETGGSFDRGDLKGWDVGATKDPAGSSSKRGRPGIAWNLPLPL